MVDGWTRDDAEHWLAAEEERTRDRLRGTRGELDGIVAASTGTNADDEHDPEGATIAFERQQVAALVRAAEDRLAEIEEARVRLAEGDYGRCESCGGPIPGARLELRPTARRCVACG